MEFSELARLASGHVEARIVQASVQLGLFDCIGDQNLDAKQVAVSLATDLRATELLLNSLVALSLLRKEGEQFYLTTAAKTYLVAHSPKSLCGMIRFDASLWSCWEKLADAVRSGKPARLADMYQETAAETEIFIQAMDSLVRARGDAEVLAHALDWENVTDLLDIGSGPASYPIHLCRRYPKLHATIFDLPATLRITARYVRDAELESRIKLVRGDYRRDAVPDRYDAIFLSNIIHGEGSKENQKLMTKLAANLDAGGRIIIKDHILDETRTNPPVGASFSLLMLLTTASGRCYSFNEVKSWFENAGLSRVRQFDLPPPLTSSLIIGEK
jgi:O-methyltransferase/methyltransferase family protein